MSGFMWGFWGFSALCGRGFVVFGKNPVLVGENSPPKLVVENSPTFQNRGLLHFFKIKMVVVYTTIFFFIDRYILGLVGGNSPTKRHGGVHTDFQIGC